MFIFFWSLIFFLSYHLQTEIFNVNSVIIKIHYTAMKYLLCLTSLAIGTLAQNDIRDIYIDK